MGALLRQAEAERDAWRDLAVARERELGAETRTEVVDCSVRVYDAQCAIRVLGLDPATGKELRTPLR